MRKTATLAGLLALASLSPVAAEPLRPADIQRLVVALQEAGRSPEEVRRLLAEQRQTGLDAAPSAQRLAALLRRLRETAPDLDPDEPEPEPGEGDGEPPCAVPPCKPVEPRPAPGDDPVARAAQEFDDLQDAWSMTGALLSGHPHDIEPILGYLEGLAGPALLEHAGYVNTALIRLRGMALAEFGSSDEARYAALRARAEGLEASYRGALARGQAARDEFEAAMREAEGMSYNQRREAEQVARAAFRAATDVDRRALRARAAAAVRAGRQRFRARRQEEAGGAPPEEPPETPPETEPTPPAPPEEPTEPEEPGDPDQPGEPGQPSPQPPDDFEPEPGPPEAPGPQDPAPPLPGDGELEPEAPDTGSADPEEATTTSTPAPAPAPEEPEDEASGR